MARILVVDDQEEVAELVQAVLRDAGHAAEAVYSGQAALDRLKRTAYDLVVCDVRMPEVDGRAVSRAIARLMPPRPVVLFITGYGDSPIERPRLSSSPNHWASMSCLPASAAFSWSLAERGLLIVEADQRTV